MKCPNCREGELEIGVTTLSYEREGSAIHVTVEGIPAEICRVCGEVYLSEAVSQLIFDLVAPLLTAGEALKSDAALPPPTVVIQFPPLEAARLERAVAAT